MATVLLGVNSTEVLVNVSERVENDRSTETSLAERYNRWVCRIRRDLDGALLELKTGLIVSFPRRRESAPGQWISAFVEMTITAFHSP